MHATNKPVLVISPWVPLDSLSGSSAPGSRGRLPSGRLPPRLVRGWEGRVVARLVEVLAPPSECSARRTARVVYVFALRSATVKTPHAPFHFIMRVTTAKGGRSGVCDSHQWRLRQIGVRAILPDWARLSTCDRFLMVIASRIPPGPPYRSDH